MTNSQTYTKMSKKGTRTKFPMYDGAEIKSNFTYVPYEQSAKKVLLKYPDGLTFSKNYKIEYQKSILNGNDYWHFILKI